MAVRQYIGARYVPLYDGTWDATKNYEPLTIVDDANGNSFTSMKDVPAGTPLTDRNYWIQTSSFSGAVEQLRREVTELQSNLTDLGDEVNGLDETKLDASGIESVKNRKFLFVGDSFGETYTSGGVTITGWLDKIANAMNITAAQMENSFAFSGMGFYANNKSWLTTLRTKPDDPAVTDVVIVGGTNDMRYAISNANDLKAAIVETLAEVKRKYVNARIYVGFCTFNNSNAIQIGDLTGITLDIYEKTVSQNGAVFMPDLTYCIFDKTLLFGNSHPNNDGTSVIAGVIASSVMGGGYIHMIHQTKAEIVADSISQASLLPTMYFSMVDNMVKMWFYHSDYRWRTSIVFGNGIASYTANGNAPIIVGRVDNLPLLDEDTVKILGSSSGWAEFEAIGWVECSVTFFLYHRYLEVIVLAQNPGYVTGTLKQLSLMSTSFTVDALSNASSAG